jgi:hypothetical protein
MNSRRVRPRRIHHEHPDHQLGQSTGSPWTNNEVRSMAWVGANLKPGHYHRVTKRAVSNEMLCD